MTSFISHLHTDLRQARYTKRGATARAKDVPMGTHKEYPRMEVIELPQPAPVLKNLGEVLATRTSSVQCPSQTLFTREDLGTLLGHALGKHTESTRRHYPSGGGLYPIETYLIAPALTDTEGGVFHYHPTRHCLERLWDVPSALQVEGLIAGAPLKMSFSALLVFTGVWKRSSAKYGDFTYLAALLEAGHMSENILLVATALGFETRPFLGFHDSKVSELLELTTGSEQPVHSVTLAKPGTPHLDIRI